MDMFYKVRNYIEDHEFHLDIYENKIHIINYKKIISLQSEKIIVLLENRKIILNGQNFSLNKLLDEEVLIEGNLISLEMKNE